MLEGLELLLGCSAGRANDIYTATDSAVSCTAETPDRAVSSKCNRMQERDKVAGGLAKEAPSSGKERLDSTAAAAYTGVALERFSQTAPASKPGSIEESLQMSASGRTPATFLREWPWRSFRHHADVRGA